MYRIIEVPQPTQTHRHIYIYIYIVEVDRRRSRPEGTPRALQEGITFFPWLLYLSFIRSLQYWVLSKETSSTIFEYFIGLDQGL